MMMSQNESLNTWCLKVPPAVWLRWWDMVLVQQLDLWHRDMLL